MLGERYSAKRCNQTEEAMFELVLVAVVVWMAYLAFMAVLGPKKQSSVSEAAGNAASAKGGRNPDGFKAILDKYETIEEVQEMLRKAGLESSNLILGIDYTKSNDYNGRSVTSFFFCCSIFFNFFFQTFNLL